MVNFNDDEPIEKTSRDELIWKSFACAETQKADGNAATIEDPDAKGTNELRP